jgi:hypothetical protein
MMVKYSVDQFKKDLFNAMVSRPGKYSGRALGDTSKQSLWTDAKITSFYNGITAAHVVFFSNEMVLQDFARLIISESMQESTGDYRLGVKPVDFTDHTSQGIIQVTSGSVLKDAKAWMKPIIGVNQRFILNPNDIEKLDLSDPGVCIVIWAWYTKNSVLMKMSMAEYGHRIEWYSQPSSVIPDYGNCLLTWLAGPRHNRHTNYAPFEDYYLRILDYYVASGFGTKEQFDNLLNTRLNPKLVGIYDMMNNKINNRNTFEGLQCIKHA